MRDDAALLVSALDQHRSLSLTCPQTGFSVLSKRENNGLAEALCMLTSALNEPRTRESNHERPSTVIPSLTGRAG